MNSGIYKITNKITNDFYIGSTIDFNNRFRQHKQSMIRMDHGNPILQNVYNKYGIEKLSFEIIEIVNKDNLLIREQHYIDKLNPKYNNCKTAGNMLGRLMSKETKKKMSKAKKGKPSWNKGKHLTKEHKDRLSKAHQGKNLLEQAKIKISKPFKVKSPDGKIYEGINLTQFSKKYNLHSSHMWEVIKGKRISHKGWKKG